MKTQEQTKNFCTLGAALGFFTIVNTCMSFQGIWPGKDFCTLGAPERLLICVTSCVYLQLS